MNAAFELPLDPKDKIVLVVLADHADADGYCFPGQTTLSRRTSVPERTLRRILDRLEALGYIARERRVSESGHRKTDGYDLSAILAGGPTGQNEGAYRPPMAGTREPSVEPPDQSIPASAAKKRGTRLPEGWKPSAGVAAAIRDECPGLDLAREHRKFSDHFAASTGAVAVKANWDAAWRNWMRRACEYQEARYRAPGQGPMVLDAEWSAFLNEDLSRTPRSPGVLYCQHHEGYPVPCERCKREASDG